MHETCIFKEDINPFNDVFNLLNKYLLLRCVSIVTRSSSVENK
jgi:hypothetical protein